MDDPGWTSSRIPSSRTLHECTLLFRDVPAKLRFSAQEKRHLKNFCRLVAERAANGFTFTCLFTNDAELQRLNRMFLEHDHPTDVLSFPSATGIGLGEIAISVERAAAQANQFRHTLLDETRLLLLHGALHLTGLDHETDAGQMRRAEQKWRAEFNLPSALIARSGRTGAHA